MARTSDYYDGPWYQRLKCITTVVLIPPRQLEDRCGIAAKEHGHVNGYSSIIPKYVVGSVSTSIVLHFDFPPFPDTAPSEVAPI